MRPWWLDVGRPPKWLIAWWIISIPAQVWALFWFLDSGKFGMFLGYFGLLAVLGPQFAWIASRKRSGQSMHCRGCEYEFAYGADAGVAHPANCPECGRVWSSDLRRGRIVGSRHWIAFWSVLAIAGILAVSYGVLNHSFLSALPTDVLIESVVRGDGPWFRWQRHWDEIRRRTLNQNQTDRLAQFVVQRMNLAESSSEYSRWLASEFRAGKISASLQNEYFQKRFRGQLRVTRAPYDEIARIELNIVDSDRDGFGPVVLVVDRVWIGPSGQSVAFGDGWRKTFVAKKDWHTKAFNFVEAPSFTDMRSLVAYAPLEAFVPHESKDVPPSKPKVRAVVWAFLHSGGRLSSGILPSDLIKNPSLDPTAQLVRSFEIETEFDLSELPGTH